MKEFILILTLISLIACSKTDEKIPQVVLDVNFELSVFNSQNEDLLDPSTAYHFDTTEIKLFYREADGEILEVIDPQLDYPRHYRLYKHENEYRIDVGLNYSCIPDNSISYIQWNENDTDTIEAQFETSDGSVLMRKVWLNGSEIWDWTSNEEEYYKLTKEIP
jgi:hypothetical protein